MVRRVLTPASKACLGLKNHTQFLQVSEVEEGEHPCFAVEAPQGENPAFAVFQLKSSKPASFPTRASSGDPAWSPNTPL